MPLSVQRCDPHRGGAQGGYSVVLTGTGFDAETEVYFAGRRAERRRQTATQVEVLVPPSRRVGPVDMMIQNGSGMTWNMFQGFTYQPAGPVITQLVPNECIAGDGSELVIEGSGFDAGAAVSVGGTVAVFQYESPTRLRGTVPDNVVGRCRVTVTSRRRVSADQILTVNGPEIRGGQLGEGPTGGRTPVTIEGANFLPTTRVHVGNNPATTRFIDANRLEIETPPGQVGAAPITVFNGQVRVALPGGFVYRAPQVESASPAYGVVGGGTGIRIRGAHFDRHHVDVHVGGVQATDVFIVDSTELYVRVPPGNAPGPVDVTVTQPDGTVGRGVQLFTYGNIAAQGTDDVTFIMDGEEFFAELGHQMAAVAAAPPNPDTYVRLAFWKIIPDMPLADRNGFDNPANTFVERVGDVIMAGHDVDTIVWYPNLKDRGGDTGKQHARIHRELADAIAAKDRTAAAAATRTPAPNPLPGRARVFLERYEGYVGSSNHQKIAIFSIAGQRTVYIGGFNIDTKYWDSDDHQRHANNPALASGWHDTAVRIQGPATDDIEAEWMRRWNRAVEMQASLLSFNNLQKQVRSRYVGVGKRATLRAAAVAIRANNTAQAAPNPTTAADIQLTRSTATGRYRRLRDALLDRIDAARHYIYLENCQLSDPEIVQALYEAMEDHPGLRVIVVTNLLDKGEGFMTRRSWLQLALRCRTCPPREITYLSKKKKDGDDPLERTLRRQDTETWNVIDSYTPSTGASIKPKQRWLLDDGLEVDKTDDDGTKIIPFENITSVDTDFHFYQPVRYRNGGTTRVMVHSKLAIIDDEYLIVGSANWTYRSMQYDGEIAAFTHCPVGNAPTFVTAARDRILAHYDEGSPLYLDRDGDNFAAIAVENLEGIFGEWAIPQNSHVFMPIFHDDLDYTERYRSPPDRMDCPSYQWI
ncbi:MAG: IPT/TIG domain-containing protein [Myxococcota bacterium]